MPWAFIERRTSFSWTSNFW